MKTFLLSISLSILSTLPWALGCGGGVSTGGAGGAGAGGVASSSSTASSGGMCTGGMFMASYASCTGTTFFPDGSCAQGSCAQSSPEKDVFLEWKKQVEALSGYDDQHLFQPIEIASVTVDPNPGSVVVRIEYVVVIDWIRSRQTDTVDLGPPPANLAPAAVTAAVKLGIEAAEWTGLAKIPNAPPEASVKAAFDTCACDIPVNFCKIDFENVTGKLLLEGFKEVDAAANKCQLAHVDLGTTTITRCEMEPCSVM